MVKKILLLFLLLALWGALSFSETIKSLPRNEETDYIKYNSTKEIKSFNPGTSIFQDFNNCLLCVQRLKPRCKPCCFVDDNLGGDLRCDDLSPLNPLNPNFKKTAFDPNTCEKQSNNCPDADYDPEAYCLTQKDCQEGGCPNLMPLEPPLVSPCKANPYGDGWLCTDSGLSPTFLGCTPENNTVSDCNAITPPYYTITPAIDPDTGEATNLYVPTTNLKACADACHTWTNIWDDNMQQYSCCLKDVCKDETGKYSKNCYTRECRALQQFPTCNAGMTHATCADLFNKVQDCIFKKPSCATFQEIDNNFFFKFVARSKQSVTITWQVVTQLKNTQDLTNLASFLYTKAQIFEKTAGGETLVHECDTNVRSLTADFLINGVSTIDKNAKDADGKPLLKQGHTYVIRVFYLLPEIYDVSYSTHPKFNLTFEVKNMDMTVYRIRD